MVSGHSESLAQDFFLVVFDLGVFGFEIFNTGKQSHFRSELVEIFPSTEPSLSIQIVELKENNANGFAGSVVTIQSNGIFIIEFLPGARGQENLAVYWFSRDPDPGFDGGVGIDFIFFEKTQKKFEKFFHIFLAFGEDVWNQVCKGNNGAGGDHGLNEH